MTAFCEKCARRVPGRVWAIAGALMGFIFAMGGVFLAINEYTESKYQVEVRTSVREVCIAGNENACRIYEVDYGSEGWW